MQTLKNAKLGLREHLLDSELLKTIFDLLKRQDQETVQEALCLVQSMTCMAMRQTSHEQELSKAYQYNAQKTFTAIVTDRNVVVALQDDIFERIESCTLQTMLTGLKIIDDIVNFVEVILP